MAPDKCAGGNIRQVGYNKVETSLLLVLCYLMTSTAFGLVKARDLLIHPNKDFTW